MTLTELAVNSRRNVELVAAVRQALPAWMDADGISYAVQAGGVLVVKAPVGMQRLLTGILPTLRRSVRRYGIRKVDLRTLRNPPSR